MKNQVETAIRTTANSKLNPKYNLTPYKKEGTEKYNERQNAMLHKRICEEVVAFMTKYPQIPLYFVLGVGVSAGACRMSEFNKGYKRFDADKVLAVHAMGMEYNIHNGIEGNKMSDVTIRLITRFYMRVSRSIDTFKARLEKTAPMGKECGKRGNYKALCDNLGIPYETDKKNETEEAANAA